MVEVNLALAGLGIGAVAALAGLGLLVTHRVTGVFNLAFGAIAMLAAYIVWAAVHDWHWPVGVAALAVIGGVCPALGAMLELAVFRPLRQRAATPAESLVASLGVFVLLVGTAFTVWGGEARLDAPSILPAGTWHGPGDTVVRISTVIELAIVAGVAVAFVVLARTGIGLIVKATVERPELSALAGLPASTVSLGGWVVGSVLAGGSGVLLAPSLRLDPYGFTLVALETMAVAVVAGLVRPGRAIAAALVIGVAQSELSRYHLRGRPGPLLESVTANLFVVALLLAVVIVPRLDAARRSDPGTTARLAFRGRLPPVPFWWVPSLLLLALPLAFSPMNLRTAQQVPALAIVLVSIVLVSGYGGQISLGQAGYAGLGALFVAKLSQGDLFGLPRVDGALAFVLGALFVLPVGVLTGWPAIRRRGLYLALTTFAVGAVVSRFVFAQPAFVSGVRIGPPVGFASDHAFYLFELAALGLALVVVRNLHRGRLGRALVAMRDDEAGAAAIGLDLRLLKILVFAVSAVLAGLGGALLAASSRAFDASAFDPIQGLVWFAAVVVFGVDSAVAAVLGAALLVGMDAAFQPGISIMVVGIAAVSIGRLPGGLLLSARRLLAATAAWWTDEPAPRPSGERRLSAAGRAVAARWRQRVRGVA